MGDLKTIFTPTPAYRQALNLTWYRAGRLPLPLEGGGIFKEWGICLSFEL